MANPASFYTTQVATGGCESSGFESILVVDCYGMVLRLTNDANEYMRRFWWYDILQGVFCWGQMPNMASMIIFHRLMFVLHRQPFGYRLKQVLALRLEQQVIAGSDTIRTQTRQDVYNS